VRQVHNPERRSSHNTHSHNTGRQDHNPERRSNHNTHSRNTGRRHNNLNLNMENLKERRKKNRIEGRMTKSLSLYENAAIYKNLSGEQESYLTLQ
jgi:hypothetical protein